MDEKETNTFRICMSVYNNGNIEECKILTLFDI